LTDHSIPAFTSIWEIASTGSIVFFPTPSRGKSSSLSPQKTYAVNYIMRITAHRETNVAFRMISVASLAYTTQWENANFLLILAVFLTKRRWMWEFLAFFT